MMKALFARSKQSCKLTGQHDRVNGQARSMNSGVNFLRTEFQTTSHRGNELWTKEQPTRSWCVSLPHQKKKKKKNTFRSAMTKKNERGIRNPNESSWWNAAARSHVAIAQHREATHLHDVGRHSKGTVGMQVCNELRITAGLPSKA